MRFSFAAILLLVLALVACADGDDASSEPRPDAGIGAPVSSTLDNTTFAVGGATTGLVGDLTLLDNGADSLVLHGDGPFAFATRVPAGKTFLVGVAKQPENQICVVTNGQGQVTADVTNIAVHCADTRSDLATLELRQGSVVARLTPTFAPSTTSYVAELHAVSTPSVDLVLTTISSDASVTVDGKAFDPATPLGYPTNEVGARAIDIVVTSAAGNAQSHYTITLEAIARYFKPDTLVPRSTGYSGALAASADRLFVGAPVDPDGAATTTGSVTVYQRTNGIWTEEARLVKPASVAASVDQFGSTLAIDADTLVVGTTGGAPVVYRLVAGVWILEQDLTPLLTDGEIVTGAVAIEGDLLVSAETYPDTGAIGLVAFTRKGTTWQRDGLIAQPTGSSEDFGSSIAISSSVVFVGAPNYDDALTNGAVYIFKQRTLLLPHTWVREPDVEPPASDSTPQFGASLAVSGGVLVVGAPDESSFGIGVDPPSSADTAPNSGAVYLFEAATTGNTLVHKLKPPSVPGPACPGHCLTALFGEHLAFDGARLLVSAMSDQTVGTGLDVTEGDFDTELRGGTVRLYAVDPTLAITSVLAIRSPNPVCAARFGSSVALSPDGFTIGDEGELCAGVGIEPDPTLVDGLRVHGAAYDYVLP